MGVAIGNFYQNSKLSANALNCNDKFMLNHLSALLWRIAIMMTLKSKD
jgi:hypothetical protein